VSRVAVRRSAARLLVAALVLGVVVLAMVPSAIGVLPSSDPLAVGPPGGGGPHPTALPAPSGSTSGPAAEPRDGAGAGSPVHAAPRPTALINPVQYYTREPAPMGIADFGVTGPGASGRGYAYATPAFEGTAQIGSMSVTISGSSSTVTAFELNAVVVLARGGTNYTYWIQNGLHVDASSHEFLIGGAYVWNFSAPGAHLSAGELVGNSSSVLVSDTYYYIPSCAASYPGQCTVLTLPTTLTGRIATSTSGGVPSVEYAYDLGSGWVTYDTVTFAHLTGATDTGFVVDGFHPTPYASSLYYDAEWDWVGAGGGSGSVDQGSDLDLSLAFWNGHNYQAVPSAWNFGSDTGETASNVTDELAGTAAVVPAAHLSSGAGALGVVYNGSTVGSLNVSVPTPAAASLLVDGVEVPFAGGWANLTVLGGPHAVALEGYENATADASVVPGTTTYVNLSGAGRVTFVESGLPAGTAWGVVVNGTSFDSTASTVSLNLPNGTYPLRFEPVAGYVLGGAPPATLTLPGTTEFGVGFAPFTVDVPVTETGLPDGTPWWVDVNHTRFNGTAGTIAVPAPNGSTPCEVGAGYEFTASPAAGALEVDHGVPVPLAVSFAYRPSFVEGTVSPASAIVSVDGVNQPITGGTYQVQLIPGDHALAFSATGYTDEQRTVTVTPGNVTWLNVTLQESPPVSTSPPPSSGGLTPTLAIAIGAGVAVAAAAAVTVVWMRRKRS
jgi:Thermopsin/PEGA domain